MTLGWTGVDERAPTEDELKAVAKRSVELHSDGSRRWCCRRDPCSQLTWAHGFLADRASV